MALGFVGQWGDLFESAVKRDFRVKDSGKILPGHGGILDRFDAILFAGFVTYWMAVGLLRDAGQMKRVIILGATGSIGVQALQVVAASTDLTVVGLSCDRNVKLLMEQAVSLGVDDLAIADEAAAATVPATLYPQARVRTGAGGSGPSGAGGRGRSGAERHRRLRRPGVHAGGAGSRASRWPWPTRRAWSAPAAW